jgi:hypothetical protein
VKTVQALITELEASELSGEQLRRCNELLMEGYARALALESRRRRLLERQHDLAGRPGADERSIRKLAILAHCEAALAAEERRLRHLLAHLRARVDRANERIMPPTRAAAPARRPAAG